MIDRMNLAASEDDFKTISEKAESLILVEPKDKTFVYSHACKLLIELEEYSMAQKFADQLMAESSKNSEASNFLFTIKSAVGDPTIIDQLPKYAKTVDEKILSKGILKISKN